MKVKHVENPQNNCGRKKRKNWKKKEKRSKRDKKVLRWNSPKYVIVS